MMNEKTHTYLCLLMLLLFLFAAPSYATSKANEAVQTTPTSKQLTGLVKDEFGDPLPGVIVKMGNVTANATTTDENGKFEITVPKDSKHMYLEFILMGMEPQKVDIMDKTFFAVELKSKMKLDEVVITGVFNVARESFTGVATTLTADDIERAGGHNLVEAISNLDPSFNLMQNLDMGSDPNALPTITMRGGTALPLGLESTQAEQANMQKANQPLFVLDGFETTLQRFMDLNQSQIESIVLLKDASATAMYGTRGSNGVLVVTTKRPPIGRLQINYKGSIELQAPDLNSYNLLNAREKLEYEKAAGLFESRFENLQLELDEIYNNRLKSVAAGVDTYWLKYPVRTGVGHNHALTIEGGKNEISYIGAVSYRMIEGVMKGSTRETMNGSVTIQYRHEKVQFSNKMDVASTIANNSPYGSFAEYGKVNSYYRPYAANGQPNKFLDETKYGGSWLEGEKNTTTKANPLYNAILPQRDETNSLTIENQTSLRWDILPKSLFIKGDVKLAATRNKNDNYTSMHHTMFSKYSEDELDRKGRYTYGTGNGFSYTMRLSGNYTKVFNDVHNISVNISGEINESKEEFYSIVGEGILVPEMDFLGQASKYEKNGRPYGRESINRSVGVAFSASYTYDSRYIIDASGRYEGSSQFGSEKRFAPFWSVGAGWNLHAEPFIKRIPSINKLRIKASYGYTGNLNFSSNMARTIYYINQTGYLGWNGVMLNGIGNEDLKWSKTGILNVGIESEFMNSRFRVDFNYYNKRTTDLITEVNLPYSSGFTGYTSNVGVMVNQGIDLSLNAKIIDNRAQKLMWSVGGAIAHNKNKIVSLENALTGLNNKAGGQLSESPMLQYRVGKSTSTIYAVRSKGIDPSNGKEIFIDLDGNETYTYDPKHQVAVGNTEPIINGRLNTFVSYKGLQIAVYFAFRYGAEVYNTPLVQKVENAKSHENIDRRAFTDRWRVPGDIAKYKSVRDNSTTYATDRFVMKDNSFTCSSISIKYRLPQKWTKKYLRANDITLGTNFTDVFRIASVKIERGWSYPFARTFVLNISARF